MCTIGSEDVYWIERREKYRLNTANEKAIKIDDSMEKEWLFIW